MKVIFKLKTVKVFNSVKCGTNEYAFLKAPDLDMVLMDNNLIRIRDSKGAEAWTSLQNVPWFTIIEDSNERSKSKSNTLGVTKKKRTAATVAKPELLSSK